GGIGNIAGAVLGCLLAGFYLLRVYDMDVATAVAVGIDVLVAASGWLLSLASPFQPAADDSANLKSQPIVHARWKLVYLSIALSGLTAMAAEVVWTRLLGLMLGATTYTFSIILAVFLVGLGIGSSVGAALARTRMNARLALGGCQLALCGTIAWAAWMLYRSLQYWPIDPALTYSPWFGFQLDILRSAWAVLPAACFWGASFPLALAAAAGPNQDPGRLVGGVYAANTIGAIVGSLLASLMLVGSYGTQVTQQILIGISLASAALMLGPALWQLLLESAQKRSGNKAGLPWRSSFGVELLTVVVAAAMVGGVWLATHVPSLQWEMVAYGRSFFDQRDENGGGIEFGKDGQLHVTSAKCLYLGEGMNSSVAVTELKNNTRVFHVSGKVEASSEPSDMRLQRMLGHIPAILHPQPKSVLIVGCGAGVTAGTFVVHPEIKRIVICEIEPLIPQHVAPYFAEENHHVVDDPRVQIVYDDARHFLLRTKEKFDIITSDPIHPWVKGAATLYTQEYFELVRNHLNPGGMVTQWVPLYESNFEAVKSEIATFFQVFPHGTIWHNDDNRGMGYDTVLLGQADPASETGDVPLKIDMDALQDRWMASDQQAVVKSLGEVGFMLPVDLIATYAGSADNLKGWLKNAEINRDNNLRLQYLAGMGLNAYSADAILQEILSFFHYPADQIKASDQVQQQLKKVWHREDKPLQ
ncbi:MAG TPA: fused MFS/spermidine synthase, partial [Pirellulales bacterium]